MKVKVRYFTTLRELAGTNEEDMEIDNYATLADLIKKVASKYGKEAREYLYRKDGKIDPSIYFLVNGVDAGRILGLNTKLRCGDVVTIIPSIGGGNTASYGNSSISFFAPHFTHTSSRIDS
ncbi:MAG: MoaD/ThiS family protein [Candidatus Bathyarchaeia archaeon]